MTRQEQAFSQLMDRLGDLPDGYVSMNNLLEIKAISAVLREHMRTVDATLDSWRQDLSVTKKVVASGAGTEASSSKTKSTPPRDGLLYVQAKVNGIDVLAMVDTGATHNFVTGRESKKNRRTDYLIHWKGETEADATWEEDMTLWQFEDQITAYWEA
ncbi:hypothetical protein ACH5RR_040883 [Cinchona calisaya]|uniref:Chromo domain-containing protein n=1 Tax=Cinchona calisaya TaxID=153742 RepID=A0ABD2XTY4_9GENT